MDPMFLAPPDIDFRPAFLGATASQAMFAALRRGIAWRQDHMRIAGREIALPRLTAWYGDPDSEYTYSGIRNVPLAWTPDLLDLKAQVEAAAGASFNSVLLNLYRTGQDSMGWHADDERGTAPTIASVSLGAVRTFQFRRKGPPNDVVAMRLTSGSLLLMLGHTQQDWQHRVPKEPASGERINLTFRLVTSPDR